MAGTGGGYQCPGVPVAALGAVPGGADLPAAGAFQQAGGAYTAQRALEAGVLDELQIHQIPVLFGQGLRLFDVLPSHVELEIVR